MEEFQEADVLWPEEKHRPTATTTTTTGSHRRPKKCGGTTPMAIPSMTANSSDRLEQLLFDSRDVDDCDKGGKENMVPPHVIVSRRCRGETPFSVCTGVGRTLKGRDLRRVRNSVLRLTGFLEG